MFCYKEGYKLIMLAKGILNILNLSLIKKIVYKIFKSMFLSFIDLSSITLY
ncbi:hypothetical protein UT300006_05580 [Clostridium sp. CTA-6]|nr:hypothetical protein CLOSPO_02964 [Clostridium sporogenes ATCC 15579]